MKFRPSRGIVYCSLHLLAVSAAAAADLGPPRGSIKDGPPAGYGPVAYAAPAYNWAGLYGGVFLGGATENWTVDFYRNNNHGHASIGSSGIAYGAYLGYNMMLGSGLVAGVEADLGSANASQSNNIFDNDTSYSTIGTFGSLRGRLGLAFNRLMIYGTAGFAFAKVTNDIQKGRNAGEEVVFDNQWQNGYVVGAGMEYAFTDHILARVEYLYSNYGTTSLTNRDGNLAELTNDMHLVRLGLTYKF